MSQSAFSTDDKDTNKMVKTYVGCIEVGNTLYEEGGPLLVDEALLLVPETMKMTIANESNVTVETIETDICTNVNNFFVIIVRGSAVCCIHLNGNYYVFDSHIHGAKGAIISYSTMDNLTNLIKTALSIQSDDLIYIGYIAIA